MFIIGDLANALRFILQQVVWLYTIVIIGACIVSFVGADPWNPLVRFLRATTTPVFSRVRRWLPFVVIGGFDLSPLVALLGLQALQIFLDGVLIQMSRGF